LTSLSEWKEALFGTDDVLEFIWSSLTGERFWQIAVTGGHPGTGEALGRVDIRCSIECLYTLHTGEIRRWRLTEPKNRQRLER
jgi:hypothetical protein